MAGEDNGSFDSSLIGKPQLRDYFALDFAKHLRINLINCGPVANEAYRLADALVKAGHLVHGDSPTLDLAIADHADLSCRAKKGLRRASIFTVAELTKSTEDDLLSMKNLGTGTLDEVKAFLHRRGLRLSDQ